MGIPLQSCNPDSFLGPPPCHVTFLTILKSKEQHKSSRFIWNNFLIPTGIRAWLSHEMVICDNPTPNFLTFPSPSNCRHTSSILRQRHIFSYIGVKVELQKSFQLDFQALWPIPRRGHCKWCMIDIWNLWHAQSQPCRSYLQVWCW